MFPNVESLPGSIMTRIFPLSEWQAWLIDSNFTFVRFAEDFRSLYQV